MFLGTYPPRECGIATFTQDLLQSSQNFLGQVISCKVAALNFTTLDTYKYSPEVEWEIDQNNSLDFRKLAGVINRNPHITGVIVQHEYGIFGGKDGRNILSFTKYCKKPILTTLHTVLPTPSAHMKSVTASVIKHSDTVVVLTKKSKEIIEENYQSSIGKVHVIPHGIHPTDFCTPRLFKKKLELGSHIVLNTFGLLSRGKGIEYAIRALPPVIKKHPTLLYLVLGETHPVVRRQEGEKYRLELVKLVTDLHLEKHVKFYDQYMTVPDLIDFLKATDIYISTSINPNQAVSGTLSYALGAGRAVVSTNFTQAKEVITPETGRLVPIQDSQALTNVLMELLGNQKALRKMHKAAYAQTRHMLWSNVAREYISLLSHSMIPQLKLDHLIKMTDKTGIFQFANLTQPNKDFGYTLDDNTRAMVLCSWVIKSKYTKELEDLIKVYLSFLSMCQNSDGTFTNYINYSGSTVSHQNMMEDLEEAHARGLWGLGEILSNTSLSTEIRTNAKELFLKSIERGSGLTHLRARAFVIKALSLTIDFLPEKKEILLSYLRHHADELVSSLRSNSTTTWHWFESYLAYNNAILSESLGIASVLTHNKNYLNKAIKSLDFLILKTFTSEMYRPIGHTHWYKNTDIRSEYDQQPEDPASMMLALQSMYSITGDLKYLDLAKKCFSWFIGNNSLNLKLYDEVTGGCYDGLHPDRVNLNQGAESLVSYLMSNVVITKMLYENSKS